MRHLERHGGSGGPSQVAVVPVSAFATAWILVIDSLALGGSARLGMVDVKRPRQRPLIGADRHQVGFNDELCNK